MNYEEAIKIINSNYNVAIHDAEGLEPEYEKEQIDALKLAIEAIKKQIKIKPRTRYGITYYCPPDCGGEEFDEYGDILICPSCGVDLEDGRYCRYCGQAIDLSMI